MLRRKQNDQKGRFYHTQGVFQFEYDQEAILQYKRFEDRRKKAVMLVWFAEILLYFEALNNISVF